MEKLFTINNNTAIDGRLVVVSNDADDPEKLHDGEENEEDEDYEITVEE